MKHQLTPLFTLVTSIVFYALIVVPLGSFVVRVSWELIKLGWRIGGRICS